MTIHLTKEVTVALVDDHMRANRYTTSYLHTHNEDIRVLFLAENGEEMIEQINIHGVPDVVVMDIRMEPMDGFEATKWLTAHHPDTKVLVQTFSEQKSAMMGMLRCGARGFIDKSSKSDDLAVAIRELATRGRYYNAWVTEAEFRDAEKGRIPRGVADIPSKRMEVLRLLCAGYSQKQIAAKHETSVYTVRGHVKKLRDTFDVEDNSALIAIAHECGVIPKQTDKDKLQ
ncbi:response regulator transcription factor [Parapedobacter sp. 10938]|uniref:response regulator transcription factor n=1 Tax=Parapedobacter flavus TaxID=3110225 RepID=UPI002DBE20AD|nr:response regulator transcription factor [Parapedobacter sp. 10938]MEC3879133.1 response regulator transcription factor [Parapedobacter sp. 10938]